MVIRKRIQRLIDALCGVEATPVIVPLDFDLLPLVVDEAELPWWEDSQVDFDRWWQQLDTELESGFDPYEPPAPLDPF